MLMSEFQGGSQTQQMARLQNPSQHNNKCIAAIYHHGGVTVAVTAKDTSIFIHHEIGVIVISLAYYLINEEWITLTGKSI